MAPRERVLVAESRQACEYAERLLTEVFGPPEQVGGMRQVFTLTKTSFTAQEFADMLERFDAARELLRLHARRWRDQARYPVEYQVAGLCDAMADALATACTKLVAAVDRPGRDVR